MELTRTFFEGLKGAEVVCSCVLYSTTSGKIKLGYFREDGFEFTQEGDAYRKEVLGSKDEISEIVEEAKATETPKRIVKKKAAKKKVAEKVAEKEVEKDLDDNLDDLFLED